MAIDLSALAAAGGTVGQLLMQKAFQDREREEREGARQEAMVPRMLQAMLGSQERAQPLGAGAVLPEGARELTIPGSDQRFAALAPPPELPKPPSVTLKRPGFDLSGTPEQVTQALPGLPVLPPEPVTFEVGGRAFPETPQGQQQALAWEKQLSTAGRGPGGTGQLPFSVSAGGITTRVGTPEEAVRLRGELTPPRQLPATVLNTIASNQQQKAVIEEALRALEERPESVGLKGHLPDFALQRFDPEGVPTRASIADIGSLVIHDRSGAANPAAEMQRLVPFIPSTKDTPEAARAKLQRMLGIIEDETKLYEAAVRQNYGIGGETPATPAMGSGGVLPPASPLSWRDRASELKAQGMAPDDVIATLRSEGLLQ